MANLLSFRYCNEMPLFFIQKSFKTLKWRSFFSLKDLKIAHEHITSSKTKIELYKHNNMLASFYYGKNVATPICIIDLRVDSKIDGRLLNINIPRFWTCSIM